MLVPSLDSLDDNHLSTVVITQKLRVREARALHRRLTPVGGELRIIHRFKRGALGSFISSAAAVESPEADEEVT